MDRVTVRSEDSKEFADIRAEAQGEGQPLARFFGFGELLGLPVLVQLHPVFDAPQEDVGGFQFLNNLLAKQLELKQTIQAPQGIRFIELWVAPAIDELQRLHQKLHFANTTRPQLHVELFPPEPVAGALGSNPVAHGAQLIEGLEVKKPAEDKRPNFPQESQAQRPLAGHRPGLEEHLPLPGLTVFQIVIRSRSIGGDQRAVLTMGPQAMVHQEDAVPFGALGQEAG